MFFNIMEKSNTLVLLLLACFTASIRSNEIKELYTYGYSYSQFFPLEENLTPDRVLRFSVRAARDAHILLAPTHEADEPVYEIVLGAQNNTVNHIRGRCPCQEEPSASVKTVNLLSAREFRNFWIRMKTERLRTFVQIGFGDSDLPFHEWRDPRPLKPQYLSFRSATLGEWRYGFRDSSYANGISKDRRSSIVTSTGFGQYFPLSDVVSHSDDDITLYFTARAEFELQVLLSPDVSTLGNVYLVGIRSNGAYVKDRHLGESKAAFQQTSFLNSKEKVRFWIKLTRDGLLTLGRTSASNPVLQWRDPNPISPQYLSFNMHQENEEEIDPTVYGDVQYGLGPDYTLGSKDCTARWKDGSIQLPPGLFRGGRYDNGVIYICRANHEGDTVPGSYIIDENQQGRCFISYELAVHQKSEFELLTGCRMKWVAAALGHVPEGAIIGGYRRGKPRYYVARVKHEGMIIVGKLQPDGKIAYVPFNGQELPFTNYEILVQIINTVTPLSAGIIAGPNKVPTSVPSHIIDATRIH